MFCISCRISTHKCLARSLCNSRHTCIDNVSFAHSTTKSRRCEKGVYLVIHKVVALDQGQNLVSTIALFSLLGKLTRRAVYFACVNFFFFNLSQIMSGSTEPIFVICLPNERYLNEFSWSGPLFPILWGTLPWQPILSKICEMAFIQHADIS